MQGKADLREFNFELKTELIITTEFVCQKAFDR